MVAEGHPIIHPVSNLPFPPRLTPTTYRNRLRRKERALDDAVGDEEEPESDMRTLSLRILGGEKKGTKETAERRRNAISDHPRFCTWAIHTTSCFPSRISRLTSRYVTGAVEPDGAYWVRFSSRYPENGHRRLNLTLRRQR